MTGSRVIYYSVSCILIFLLLFIYSYGAGGDFIFDDLSNIVNNDSLYLESFTWNHLREILLSGFSGFMGRPLPTLTFALNYYFSGTMDPFWFKWTNILIHVVNSVLIYCLLQRLFSLAKVSGLQSVVSQSKFHFIPLVAASIWALHPLHVSSVLYSVQRMNLMATLFSLCTLLAYIRLRTVENRNLFRVLVYLTLTASLIICGLMSKENAALVMFYIGLLELFLFQGRITFGWDKLVLWLIIGCGIVIPTAIVVGYSLVFPDWILADYLKRDFTLAERLLTQARLFWTYISWIVVPDITSYGFHHDDIAKSTGLLSPISTLFSVFALCIYIGVLFFWRKLGLITFGLAFFLFGHLMESTFIALELVFEHRNYLPSLGLIIALSMAFCDLLSRAKFDVPKSFGYVFVCLICGLLAFSTKARAEKWGDTFFSAAIDMLNHPQSARSHHTYAVEMMKKTNVAEQYNEIAKHFALSSDLDQTGVGGHYGQIFLDLSVKKAVDPALIEEMIFRISNTKPRAETMVFVDDLFSVCQRNDCNPYFNITYLERMVDGALSNTKIAYHDYIGFQVLKARYYITFAKNYPLASDILMQVIEHEPNHFAANAYLMELKMVGKSYQEKEELIEVFARSNVGKLNPTLLEQLRKFALVKKDNESK